MKRTLKSLYKRTTEPTNWPDHTQPDEKLDWSQAQEQTSRDFLSDYLAEAERVAGNVIANSDAKTPEVSRAEDILFAVRSVRHHIAKGDAKTSALEAIRLAQHVERFNNDELLKDAVDVGSRVINGSGNRKPDYTAEVEQYKAEYGCSLTKAREEIAKREGISERTLIRQSQK